MTIRKTHIIQTFLNTKRTSKKLTGIQIQYTGIGANAAGTPNRTNIPRQTICIR